MHGSASTGLRTTTAQPSQPTTVCQLVYHVIPCSRLSCESYLVHSWYTALHRRDKLNTSIFTWPVGCTGDSEIVVALVALVAHENHH